MKLSTGSRIMLKLSGEALKGSGQYGFDVQFLDTLAEKIVALSKRGLQLSIVLGGGNIFRGATGAQSGMDRATGDYIGMLATIMNGIALGEALTRKGQKNRVLSSVEMPKIAELFVMKKAIRALSQGEVVICVAGTGNPFFTTDTCAVQKSLELGCEIMIKGTKVDGVYDKDPKKYSDAMRFDTLSIQKALEIGVDVMDHSALSLAMDNKLPLFVCKIDQIELLGTDTQRGTFVTID